MQTPPLARSLGTAERLMRALLARELAREKLSFVDWTTLVFTHSAALTADQLATRQLAGHAVDDESEAHAAMDRLLGRGLLADAADGTLRHAAEGARVFAALGQSIDGITQALYGDLPRAELETTHQTLLEIASRASTLLATK